MPLETATYVTDLVTANPAHTDGLAQADSHARLIKSALKNTFPNFTSAALTSTQAQIDNATAASAGTNPTRFPLGTALLPGLTPVGDPDTGWWSPAANQAALSLAGVQVLLMGGTALVTTLSISCGALSAASVASTGAYSGGTGQLVPVGGTILWWDDVLPTEGGYAWANGQIIASANTVCPVLLARWGTRFGGNGTTTMGVPDMRDAVPVGKSTMGGVSSRGLQTLANTVLGTLIGLANNVLVTLNLPPYTPAGSIANGAITITNQNLVVHNTGGNLCPGGGATGAQQGQTLGATQAASTFTGTAQGGTSTPINNVQPSVTCNYIIRLA